MVSFIWPWVLLSLLGVPVCIFFYMRLQGKRKAAAERLGALGGVWSAASTMAGKRRHIPPIILLMAAMVLAVASARPQVSVPLPRLEGTIMLVMDVSSSMAAEDVLPSRLEVAKLTAKALIQERPPGALIGVIAFSRGGLVVQPPTSNTEALNASIDRLIPDHGTSLGGGIRVSLNFLLQQREPRSIAQSGEEEDELQRTTDASLIVLVTDGENTDPPDPVEAAQLAIERGVRVYTVGVGTTEGAVVQVEGFNLFTQLNEPMLQEIALQSEGTYFSLDNVDDIPMVYEDLNKDFVVESREIEITSILGGFGALLLLAAAAISLFWFGRTP